MSIHDTRTHRHRTVEVAVPGGTLTVAVWDPVDDLVDAPTALLVHGITASHLAWSFVVSQLPGVRLVAPDLRGRGRSEHVDGPAGMAVHADDLALVLDALDIDRVPVIAHSMGAFVAVVLAHRHPDRVSRLVLIDGGLPLDLPRDADPDALVSGLLGPTAARLSMRFADDEEYLEFWRGHPAFCGHWSEELERYLRYDLVDDGHGALRPVTSYRVMIEDTLDSNMGEAVPAALAALRHPTTLLTAPRGYRDEPPGLYAPGYLSRLLAHYPGIAHTAVLGVNHYTIIMAPAGARVVGSIAAQAITRMSER